MQRTKVLDKREEEAHKKVLNIYNLKREDFDNEDEFDNYLEEREDVLYCFLHDVNIDEAEARRRNFQNNYNRKIELRRVEQMDSQRRGCPVVLPLRGQIRYEKRVRAINLTSRVAFRNMYSDVNYLAEMRSRKDNWEPQADVPPEVVGGAGSDVFREKALAELKNTLQMLGSS